MMDDIYNEVEIGLHNNVISWKANPKFHIEFRCNNAVYIQRNYETQKTGSCGGYADIKMENSPPAQKTTKQQQ